MINAVYERQSVGQGFSRPSRTREAEIDGAIFELIQLRERASLDFGEINDSELGQFLYQFRVQMRDVPNFDSGGFFHYFSGDEVHRN